MMGRTKNPQSVNPANAPAKKARVSKGSPGGKAARPSGASGARVGGAPTVSGAAMKGRKC